MENEVIKAANNLFDSINKIVSNGDIYLLDKLFPKRDGVEDTVYLSTLYDMQQSLHSAKQASEIALKHVTGVIDVIDNK